MTTANQHSAPTSAPQTQPQGSATPSGTSSNVQLKSALRGLDYATQLKELAPGVQRSGEGGGEADVHAAAAAGTAGTGASLPHLDKIQEAFGSHDVSEVQAHVGGDAKSASAAMGAEAYASGNDVAFADAPSLHTAAHEAAHVVQQDAGVSLSGGVGKAGDGYEQHADHVADAVVAGKSAEPILNEMAGGGGGGGVQQKAVQRIETTPPVTETTPPVTESATDPSVTAPVVHPAQADLDADRAQIGPPADLADFRSRVKALKVLAQSEGVAAVDLKVTKFLAAVPRLRAQLIKPAPEGYGPGDGATKAAAWIDAKVAIVEGYLRTNFPTKAQAAHDKITAAGAVNDSDKFDPDWGTLVDFGAGGAAFAPEETFSIADLTAIGGVFKVYDVGKVFGMMGADYKAAWNASATAKGVATGQALFIQECKAAERIVYAPQGEGRNPPFAGANADKVFSEARAVTAFVGLGRDANAANFADALVKYQLKDSYYPSKAMLACKVGPDVLTANWGNVSLGKPSIMNLLVFNENVYDETDRTFGHLADPADPTKPGANLELTIVGMPLEDFMRANGTQVLV